MSSTFWYSWAISSMWMVIICNSARQIVGTDCLWNCCACRTDQLFFRTGSGHHSAEESSWLWNAAAPDQWSIQASEANGFRKINLHLLLMNNKNTDEIHQIPSVFFRYCRRRARRQARLHRSLAFHSSNLRRNAKTPIPRWGYRVTRGDSVHYGIASVQPAAISMPPACWI